MDLIMNFISTLDLEYILMCNTVTYLVVQVFSKLHWGDSTVVKRFISCIVATFLALVLYYNFHHELEGLFYGFFLQFLSWDYFFKPIIKRLQAKINGE